MVQYLYITGLLIGLAVIAYKLLTPYMFKKTFLIGTLSIFLAFTFGYFSAKNADYDRYKDVNCIPPASHGLQ